MKKQKPKEPSKKISATDKLNAEYTVSNAFKHGDKFTKLSMFILGAGNLAHKEYIKGILFLLTEILFIIQMLTTGLNSIYMLGSLGTKETGEVFNESKQVYEYVIGDNSMLILLYGVATFFLIAAFVIIWRAGVKSAYKVQVKSERNQHIPSFKEEMLTYLDGNLHKTLLFFPSMGIILFTIIPVVFMMTMAFTNYDRDHQPPGNLFHWIGLTNFSQVLDFSGELGRTFWSVLGWTVVWAFFATFLNYFFSMIVALVINRKGTKFKSFWRFGFVLSIAVPQFVSLLIMNTMLQPEGAVNVLLRNLGFLAQGQSLPFWTDVTWARVTLIIVNLWVGIPYGILTMTGILQNIPEDLYEAARVDGANTVVIFFKITLPYMLFVTAPKLITDFVANINNFNVIYLLTGGAPATMDYYKMSAGKTDLLVTWLYKLTIEQKDYNLGAVISIFIFIISAVSALVVFKRTGSYKNEEGFQ
ncbi:carbohydrate ABC transporter permease [uncultured Clostridium sp.]|uniref:carbohydrate ABC transporter permease n=1 Tax=uncultured Clostridium sp. TaxID=59620 RepID=UPI0025CD12C6|nr:sugar ABC transporter permease [uncultured Clostridium sp.]